MNNRGNLDLRLPSPSESCLGSLYPFLQFLYGIGVVGEAVDAPYSGQSKNDNEEEEVGVK
jgi:hypothetical protein